MKRSVLCGDLFFQPTEHFLTFCAALNLNAAAVLLAFAVQIAEAVNEGLKLVDVHSVSDIILGDVDEQIGVNILFIEVPDIVKGNATLAEAGTDEGEAAGLNAEAHIADSQIGVLVIGGVVMAGALNAIICAPSPFAGDTGVLVRADAGADVRGLQSGYFLSLS